MKLGKRELDSLACAPGQREFLVFDEELPGFGVRVTAKGTKVFLVQYRAGGKARRLRLGAYGVLTPTQARQRALIELGKIAAGADPVDAEAERRAAELVQRAAVEAEAARRERESAFTIEVLASRWAAEGLASRSAQHRAEGPRAVRHALDTALPVSSLDADAAQLAIDAIVRTRPVMGRRTRDYARAMFNWALARRLVASNPFAAVVVDAREISRDRYLSDEELFEAWRAAGNLGHPFGPFIRLLILTLQRRGELAGMRWDEVSLDWQTWTIPKERAKSGKSHIVHLAPAASAILRKLPRKPGESLVFSMTGETPVSGFSRAMHRLHAEISAGRAAPAAGAPPLPAITWRLHDFRRTGVTGLAALGVQPHVADRLLNHVQGSIKGVAAVYQRHQFLDERKAALDLWAEHVTRLTTGRAAGRKGAKPVARRGRSPP